MANFPGTVKTFITKLDQVDTVYAENINSLQDELSAIETVLGTNPQGVAATVGVRLTQLESEFLSLSGDQSTDGNKTFTGLTTFTGPVRSSSTGTLTGIAATTNPFQVGLDAGLNVAYDDTRIQARNAGAPADLHLQPYGGNAWVGSGQIWTTANMGSGSGLNADLLDGSSAGAFATAGHRHPADFVQVVSNNSLNVPSSNTTAAGWVTVSFNIQEVYNIDSGAQLYYNSVPSGGNVNATQFFTPPAVGRALYFHGFRCSFNQNNTGLRGVRFLDSNSQVIDQVMMDGSWTSQDFVALSGMYYYAGQSGYYIQVQVWQDSGTTLALMPNQDGHRLSMTHAVVCRTAS